MRIIVKIVKGIGFVCCAFFILGVVGLFLGDDDATTSQPPTSEQPPIVQETTDTEQTPEGAEVETPIVEETPAEGTKEQQTALRSAERYLQVLAMSKGKLYDQLIYEQFSAEQAQYAVDTIEADWNEQAVKSAQNYQKTMPLSSGKLYDQLIYEQFTPEQAQYAIDNLSPAATESGSTEANETALRSAENYLQVMPMSKGKLYDQLIYEQFSAEQAQYAVDTIQADWNEQALKSAQNYQQIMPMSSGKLYDQLIYEQFTPEQAQYAIDHL